MLLSDAIQCAANRVCILIDAIFRYIWRARPPNDDFVVRTVFIKCYDSLVEVL